MSFITVQSQCFLSMSPGLVSAQMKAVKEIKLIWYSMCSDPE